MKNNGFTIDHVNKQIVVSKAFLARASQLGTQEFEKVRELMEMLPRYKFVQKESIKKNPNKKTYRNLTYENMERYIRATEKNPDIVMERFHNIKERSHAQTSRYAYVKKWFLQQYPDYTEVTEEQEADTNISTVEGTERLTIRSQPQKDGDGKEQMGQKRYSKAEAKGGPS